MSAEKQEQMEALMFDAVNMETEKPEVICDLERRNDTRCARYFGLG